MSDNGFHRPSPRQFDALAAAINKPNAEWGTPIFTHDCTSCIYLGPYDYQSEGWGLVDLYFCPGRRLPGSVVYRYGDEGHEYGSMDLGMIIMRDYHDPADNAYHTTLRRIFDQQFTTMCTDLEDREFRVRLSVVEVKRTDCPNCRPKGWSDGDQWLSHEPDEDCDICLGHGSTSEEIVIGGVGRED